MSVQTAIGIDPSILGENITYTIVSTTIPTTPNVTSVPLVYSNTFTLPAGKYLFLSAVQYAPVNTTTPTFNIYTNSSTSLTYSGNTIPATTEWVSTETAGDVKLYNWTNNLNYILDLTASTPITFNVYGESDTNNSGDFEISGYFKYTALP
jgi:hypothetical protein